MHTPARVVIAHDYVTQRGGAERTVLGLLAAFPGARLLTSVYNPSTTFPEFQDHDIETLWLDRVPLFRRDPRLAFPWLAKAWSQHVVADADVVVCSSSGWAHAVATTGTKVVYCHNTARWLYQADDYLNGVPRPVRWIRHALAPRLIEWDRQHAAEAAQYVVNSRVVASRVLEHYSRDAAIIPPPITLDPDAAQEPVPGVAPGFLLTVSRPRGYKNVRLVTDAVAGMPDQRLVVIGCADADMGRSGDNVTLLGRVSDSQLRWLYANCSALVSASHEDFGLTPLEANLFGRPAVLLRGGGFLETLVEGITGCFIEAETVEAVQAAIRRIPATDARVLKTYAEGFRSHVFAQRMQAVVADALQPTLVGSALVPEPRHPLSLAAS